MTLEYNPTREKSICSGYLRLGSCYDAAPYGAYAHVGEQYAGPGQTPAGVFSECVSLLFAFYRVQRSGPSARALGLPIFLLRCKLLLLHCY